MAHISIRIEEKDKNKAREILEDLGLDLSSGIKIFLKAVVRHKGIPFPVSENIEIPENLNPIQIL